MNEPDVAQIRANLELVRQTAACDKSYTDKYKAFIFLGAPGCGKGCSPRTRTSSAAPVRSYQTARIPSCPH